MQGSADGTDVMKPLRMYFQPTEYKKKVRISTRCYVKEFLSTLDKLEPPLVHQEKNWFERHQQFKHIFHLPKDKNHKLQAMWMLLLRTAGIEKKKEAWFVVNGVPIRYGLREHALISGLSCTRYPQNLRLGQKAFVRRHFGTAKVRYEDVKKKLEDGMEAGRDRLKMLVLYFLCSIIKGQIKCGPNATPIEDFILRVVDDLDLCKRYPWGRFSFEYMLSQIYHMIDKFDGVVQDDILRPIAGFCIPMELLAFEAIPDLQNSFREPIPDADDGCPRMCKSKFMKSEMRGFPLSKINEKLGETKIIHSIICPVGREVNLLSRLFEEDDDDDRDDPVVRGWIQRINEGKTILFEDMHKDDVDARKEDEPEAEQEAEREEGEREEGGRGVQVIGGNDFVTKEIRETSLVKLEEG